MGGALPEELKNEVAELDCSRVDLKVAINFYF